MDYISRRTLILENQKKKKIMTTKTSRNGTKNPSKIVTLEKNYCSLLRFVVNFVIYQLYFNFNFFPDRCTFKLLKVKCNPTNKKSLTLSRKVLRRIHPDPNWSWDSIRNFHLFTLVLLHKFVNVCDY